MDDNRQGDQVFELSIAPQTSRYDPEDDRWRVQISQLLLGLQQEVGGVRRDSIPSAGTKGGVESIVVALGSAGAFTATVEFVRAWLGRDRSRSLEISWSAEGARRVISVTGDAIDVDALTDLAQAVALQMGSAG